MGVAFSATLDYALEKIGLFREEIPPIYERVSDFNPSGKLRAHVPDYQVESYKLMQKHEYITRDMLLPIVNKRIKWFYASLKYTQSQLTSLLEKFPKWTKYRIFDLHDAFQVFEVDGDGLIETAEMTTALDNLGDHTPPSQRRAIIQWNDSDGTGNIDFEEFLTICYDMEYKYPYHSLGASMRRIDKTCRYIRLLSTPQQIRAGFY